MELIKNKIKPDVDLLQNDVINAVESDGNYKIATGKLRDFIESEEYKTMNEAVYDETGEPLLSDKFIESVKLGHINAISDDIDSIRTKRTAQRAKMNAHRNWSELKESMDNGEIERVYGPNAEGHSFDWFFDFPWNEPSMKTWKIVLEMDDFDAVNKRYKELFGRELIDQENRNYINDEYEKYMEPYEE